MIEEELHYLSESLLGMLVGSPLRLPASVSEETAPAFAALETLYEMYRELESFASALADGELDSKIPSRKNYLSGGLRQLHAQLKHLTWQAQCVARGDYNQRIDFMGNFAESFNTMVDQLRTREAHLTAQRDVMMRIFDSVEPIIILDPATGTIVLYANRMARARFGLAGEQCHLPDISPVLRKVFSVRPNGGSKDIYDEHARRWYSVSAAQLPWTGEQLTVLYHCTDITPHKQREQLLAHHAHTDPLTGLMNRRGFDSALGDAWLACAQSQSPLSILLFDIDFFKSCNDRYGHPQGDQCLMEFGRLLSRSFGRSNDIVARYGGEEFIAVLPNTLCDNALMIAEKIRSATEAMAIPLLDQQNMTMRITVSCGVSCAVPEASGAMEPLIAAADQALYAAKQAGRNRVMLWNPSIARLDRIDS